MYGQPNDSLVAFALVAIGAFIAWLVLFTGEGYKGIIEDLKSSRRKKIERFPVPVFDRSKIELPRPKKPKIQAIVRGPIDFNEEQLRDWANQLQESIREIRREATELAKAYNSMPPSLVEDPSKPRRKPAAKAKAVKKAVKKKPATKKAVKKKPATKKAVAKKPVKKTAPKRPAKLTKKAAPKRKGR